MLKINIHKDTKGTEYITKGTKKFCKAGFIYLISNFQEIYTVIKNFIPNTQYGFREQHSMLHSLCKLLEDMEYRNTTYRFRKSVPQIEIKSLQHKRIILNIPPYITNIIQSYLYNRTFLVQVEGENSLI